MRIVPKFIGACLIYVMLASSGSAQIQVRPTIGGFDTGMVQSVLNNANDYVRVKSKFNALIVRARARFFKNYPNGQELADAEKEFSRLLLEKDYTLMPLYVAYGTSRESRKRAEGIDRITFGQIDGGIDRRAWPSYARWIEAIRSNLGARNNSEGIVVFDPAKLSAAIHASEAEYRSYKIERDRAEFFRQGLLDEAAVSSAAVPEASFRDRWARQCVAEAKAGPDPKGSISFCACVVNGIEPIEPLIPAQVKAALATDFKGNLRALWESVDKSTMTRAIGGCYR